VLHLVASVHERAGRCAQAYQAGLLGGRLRRELGPTPTPGLVLSAAAELNGGSVGRAAELADTALSSGQAAGDAEWSAYALGLRGRCDLLAERYQQAAEHLGRCRELLHGLGYSDPALFLVDADLAEALAWSGESAAARRVLAEAQREVARLDRRVVRLGLARAAAVLAAVDGDPRGAADRLRAALPAAHPYPLELARAQLTLGELERRARRRATARTELLCAAEAFDAAQCLPWLAHSRRRLARLDAPAAEPTELERQIVRLVRAGATNRQIAAALHVSVKSVEGSLTRLFRRYGVRDRAGLTAVQLPGATDGS
jgi:DNA-binding CsgD family transcriptional regulator